MGATIPETFFEIAKKYPNKIALAYKKEGVYFPITYSELLSRIYNFAGVLKKLGIAKGDRVAILSENRPEWVVSDIAIMALGAITVPLHATLSSKSLLNVLNHCQAKILIVSTKELLNKISANQENLDFIQKIILVEKSIIGVNEEFKNQLVSWDSLSIELENKFIESTFNSDDPCSIIYTSGTTGEPKGVVLTHKNFLSNVDSVDKAVPIIKEDVFLSFLPLSHVLERMAGSFTPLLRGASIFYSEGIKHITENMKEVRPTIMISVPRVFEKFHDAVWDKINASSPFKKAIFKWALKQDKSSFFGILADILVYKKIRQFMGGNIRLVVSGGASLNKTIAKFFLKMKILILEGYGLTETSPVVAVNRISDFRFGSVGKVVSGVSVKISESKEILVKGPSVFKEYFNNQEATKVCFTEDGWFKTGDLGFIDKDEFLTIIGRAKEMIVTSGGKNVWPEQIENLLNNDKYISQSMVIGNKRKFVSALIVPDWQEIEIFLKEKGLPMQDRGVLINDQSIVSLFQERLDKKINPELNDFEKVKGFRLLTQEFSQEANELTPTLKLRRHIIEQHNEKLISSIYL